MAEKWLIFNENWLSRDRYLVLIEWPLYGFQVLRKRKRPFKLGMFFLNLKEVRYGTFTCSYQKKI